MTDFVGLAGQVSSTDPQVRVAALREMRDAAAEQLRTEVVRLVADDGYQLTEVARWTSLPPQAIAQMIKRVRKTPSQQRVAINGAKLKRLRVGTLVQLAEETGINKAHLSRIETGAIKTVYLDTLLKLEKAVGTELHKGQRP